MKELGYYCTNNQKTDYNSALQNFEKANELKENIADLWLAKTHAQLGNTENAILHLTQHLSSNYKLEERTIKTDLAFDELQYTDEWFTLWQKKWYSPEESLREDINFFIKKDDYNVLTFR